MGKERVYMRKICLFPLVGAIVLSSLPIALADHVDYTSGTLINFTANSPETYNVTVPAQLSPGESGVVSLTATIPSNVTIDVTADDVVVLSNNLDDNTKTLNVHFDGISKSGNNLESVSASAPISIDNITNALFGQWSGKVEYYVTITRESIEPENNLVYFNSLPTAVEAIKTGTIEDSSNADAETAIVGVQVGDQDNNTTLKLLTDTVLDASLNLESDIILDLNGQSITTTVTPAINIQNANVVVDGEKPGSSITVNAPAGQKGIALNIISGQLTVNGGTYSSNTAGAGTSSNQTHVICAESGTTLNVSNAIITGVDSNNGSVNGVTAKSNTVLNLTNCDITVESGESLENRGVQTEGTAVLKNCNIIAKADYTGNAAGTNYASNSRGVWSKGKLEMYDCYVFGAHAGVTVQGTVYVDGGSYNGYGHGGLYLAGADGQHYFYNAEFNWAPMVEGTVADTVAGTNGAGFYIGGASNQVAYFDNCKFNMVDGTGHIYKNMQLPFYGIVMRTSGSEKNNIVYISNSYALAANTQMFRGVGTSGMTVYNGTGNDWSKVAKLHTTNDTYFINTEDSYAP